MKLTFTLRKDKETVHRFLTEPDKFVSVHPLIQKMTPIGVDEYKVYELINLGPLPYRFQYRARIHSSPDQILIRANVMGLTHIDMNFTLTSVPDGTLVEEDIQIRSLLPIKKLMHKIFREQHEILFRNVEAWRKGGNTQLII